MYKLCRVEGIYKFIEWLYKSSGSNPHLYYKLGKYC